MFHLWSHSYGRSAFPPDSNHSSLMLKLKTEAEIFQRVCTFSPSPRLQRETLKQYHTGDGLLMSKPNTLRKRGLPGIQESKGSFFSAPHFWLHEAILLFFGLGGCQGRGHRLAVNGEFPCAAMTALSWIEILRTQEAQLCNHNPRTTPGTSFCFFPRLSLAR